MLRDTVDAPRWASVGRIIDRAVARGELPDDCDVELVLDVVASPLYWRLLVRRQALDASGVERLADGVLAAIAAVSQPGEA